MKSVIWSRLDLAARSCTPFGLTVLLIFLSIMPLQVPGLTYVMPLLPLMSIYLWAVHQPELMPIYAVFLIGLLHDALSGVPFGIYCLTYMIVSATVLWQRRFLVGKSFMVIWVGFTVVTAGALVIGWLLISVLHTTFITPGAMAFQYLISLGVFPLMALFFMRGQRAFVDHV